MKLELFDAVAEDPRGHPLLFVHGSFCSGAVWAEYFLPYFQRRGFAAHALSLRGHGNSEGHTHLGSWTLADFVDDLASVADELPIPPILVGHSMGGMVVQKYLERQPPVAGVVLMGSVPPQGLLSTLLAMSISNPLLFQQVFVVQTMGPQYAFERLFKNALFASDLPEDRLRDFFDHFQGESQRVVLDLCGLDPLDLDPRVIEAPFLVLGAEDDPFLSRYGVERTARFYEVRPEFLPVGHAMMLDANWALVADRIRVFAESIDGTRTSDILSARQAV